MLTEPGLVSVTFLSRFHVGNLCFEHADTVTSDSVILIWDIKSETTIPINEMNALYERTAHKKLLTLET